AHGRDDWHVHRHADRLPGRERFHPGPPIVLRDSGGVPDADTDWCPRSVRLAARVSPKDSGNWLSHKVYFNIPSATRLRAAGIMAIDLSSSRSMLSSLSLPIALAIGFGYVMLKPRRHGRTRLGAALRY